MSKPDSTNTLPRNEASLNNLVLANLKLILRAHCLVSPGVSLLKASQNQTHGTEVRRLLVHHTTLGLTSKWGPGDPSFCPFQMLPALSSTLKSLSESPPNSKVAPNFWKLCVSGEQGLTWSQLPLFCSREEWPVRRTYNSKVKLPWGSKDLPYSLLPTALDRCWKWSTKTDCISPLCWFVSSIAHPSTKPS